MRTLLCPLGHIASYQELIRLIGGPDSSAVPFRQTAANLRVRRIRNNVYVCAHLDAEELAAARVGAPLDCVTVLGRHGVLATRSADCLHLRVRHGDRRAAERRHAEPRVTRAHWSTPYWPLPSLPQCRAASVDGAPVSRLEMPLQEALRQALVSCLDIPESLAAIAALTAAAHAAPPLKTPYVFPTPTTLARAPRLAARPRGAQHETAPGLRPEQLATVLTRIPARTRTRLVRAGLPPEVDAALEKLL